MDNSLFQEHRVFTVATAKKYGFNKSMLKTTPGIVCLGAFPVRQKNGSQRMEKIFTYNPELQQLINKATKLSKNPRNKDSDEAKLLVQSIENKVREILYPDSNGAGNDSQVIKKEESGTNE